LPRSSAAGISEGTHAKTPNVRLSFIRGIKPRGVAEVAAMQCDGGGRLPFFFRPRIFPIRGRGGSGRELLEGRSAGLWPAVGLRGSAEQFCPLGITSFMTPIGAATMALSPDVEMPRTPTWPARVTYLPILVLPAITHIGRINEAMSPIVTLWAICHQVVDFWCRDQWSSGRARRGQW